MILSGDFGEIYHIEGDYLHNILHKITKVGEEKCLSILQFEVEYI